VAPRRSPADLSFERVCQGLGSGERSAILLAKSLPADLILLDEWKARRIAREAGLTMTGTHWECIASSVARFEPALPKLCVECSKNCSAFCSNTTSKTVFFGR
jgi:hypothetical protein